MSCPFNPHDRSFANLPRRFTGEPRKALQTPRVIAELSSILSGFPQIGSPKGSSSIPVIIARVCALPCRVSPISLPEGSAFTRVQQLLSYRRSTFMGFNRR